MGRRDGCGCVKRVRALLSALQTASTPAPTLNHRAPLRLREKGWQAADSVEAVRSPTSRRERDLPKPLWCPRLRVWSTDPVGVRGCAAHALTSCGNHHSSSCGGVLRLPAWRGARGMGVERRNRLPIGHRCGGQRWAVFVWLDVVEGYNERQCATRGGGSCW